MRTALIIIGGFALWGICLALGRIFGQASAWTSTIAFVLLWFGVAVTNMWYGVAKAAYGFTEELPIFLIIFLLPSVASIVVKWKFL